jgi:hypothetical protein
VGVPVTEMTEMVLVPLKPVAVETGMHVPSSGEGNTGKFRSGSDRCHLPVTTGVHSAPGRGRHEVNLGPGPIQGDGGRSSRHKR